MAYRTPEKSVIFGVDGEAMPDESLLPMTKNPFVLSRDTTISSTRTLSPAIWTITKIFARDFRKVLGDDPLFVEDQNSALLQIRLDTKAGGAPESYRIHFEETGGQTCMILTGQDELGLIYGLLHISERYLGVDPLWFWTDKEPTPRALVSIDPIDYASTPQRIRYRGWFVNDEVCLIGWTEDYPPPRSVWEPVFEALLRMGGNLVIPGTDLPRSGEQASIASQMGLYVTHHHAEPLGAEMFFRAYPDREASYDSNPELFEGLWQEAIEAQKDRKIVWTLGFRGQGDCPFWEQDPSYDTPERRGELISRAVKRQHEMLNEMIPGAPCVTYIYGEIAELYREGHITFPDGVTKIWSDNGYGRMVSRRQHNHNPRIPSLPEAQEKGPHGIYYHAAFHDLQASSHLTMLPVATSLIADELTTAFNVGTDHLLLVNCGNIRPHIYTLGVIARLWRDGMIDAQNAPLDFAQTYFGSSPEKAAKLIEDFIVASIAYGPHNDDRAGDEFYHHPARSLIGHVLRGETKSFAQDLSWATGNIAFAEQVRWFREICMEAIERFAAVEKQCLELREELPRFEAQLLEDFLLFQVQLHRSGAQGLAFLSQGIEAYLAGAYPQAFVEASKAYWAYQEGLGAMEASEHGKWKHFFRADWLTNIRITLYAVQSLRMFLRTFGDNPDYFLWHKEYLMPESEKKIYLENTHRNPPSDDDLAKRLQAHFGL